MRLSRPLKNKVPGPPLNPSFPKRLADAPHAPSAERLSAAHRAGLLQRPPRIGVAGSGQPERFPDVGSAGELTALLVSSE